MLSYRGEWIAQIFADGKETKLGSFATEEEAARSYDEAAREAMRRPGARCTTHCIERRQAEPVLHKHWSMVGLPRRSRRVNFPRKGELPALREGVRSASQRLSAIRF